MDKNCISLPLTSDLETMHVKDRWVVISADVNSGSFLVFVKVPLQSKKTYMPEYL